MLHVVNTTDEARQTFPRSRIHCAQKHVRGDSALSQLRGKHIVRIPGAHLYSTHTQGMLNSIYI